MFTINKYQNWIEKKVEALDVNDKYATVKAWAYGALGAIPEGLAVIGLETLAIGAIRKICKK